MTIAAVSRILVAAVIVVLLVRAARVAWYHRELVLGVWRAITWRHLLGGLAVVALLITGLQALEAVAPFTRLGLGDLVGFTGNATFLPLEEAVAAAGPAPATGPDWVLIALTSAFLLPLLVMLPWLAYAEEELFRAGVERHGLGREMLVALVFGLAHLVMLVPLSAALVVGAAGFFYGRMYRRAVQQRVVPPSFALTAYRPTKRARVAVEAATGGGLPSQTGVGEALVAYEHQAAGVFASTVWHTTVNSLIIVAVYGSIVLYALQG